METVGTMATKPVTARIDEDLVNRLEKATDRSKDPYAPSKSQIIERGIELALRELERRK